MKRPVMNIIGLVLILTVLSMIAVKSVKSGKGQVDSININESDGHDIASICSRIDRLSNYAERQKTSVKSASYRDHKYKYHDEYEVDETSEEYLADYYPDKIPKKCPEWKKCSYLYTCTFFLLFQLLVFWLLARIVYYLFS
jgi:hypothetical protein